MKYFEIALVLYFLVSLRSLGQEVYDGVATSDTYTKIVLAVLICGYSLVRIWVHKD